MNLQTDKELYDFLAGAPKEFTENEKIKKFQLKNGDFIHCVLWNMHFYITGTDIVKILVWRFQNAGRQIVSLKKFEEGVFSDLRNLKPGIDATLEGPRSDFLEFLYKNGCIRTQKKQKVFFWYSVPHDALFCDALERDLRRETNLYAYSKYYTKNNYSNTPFSQQDSTFEGWQQQNMNPALPQGMPPQNVTSQQIVSQGMPPHMMPHQGGMPPQLIQPHMPYMPGQNMQMHAMPDYYMDKPMQLPPEKEFFSEKPDGIKFSDQPPLDQTFPQKHHEFNFTPHFDPKDLEMDPKEFEKHFKMFEMGTDQEEAGSTNKPHDEMTNENGMSGRLLQLNGHICNDMNAKMNRMNTTQLNNQMNNLSTVGSNVHHAGQFNGQFNMKPPAGQAPDQFNGKPDGDMGQQPDPQLSNSNMGHVQNQRGYYDPTTQQFINNYSNNRQPFPHMPHNQMPVHYEQELYNDQVMMPELDEEYVEPDMIIPNKGGESEQ